MAVMRISVSVILSHLLCPVFMLDHPWSVWPDRIFFVII